MPPTVSPEVRAAGGDRAAFSTLMTETKPDLYRFIRRYVGDAEEAQDLLQETYASAWLAMGRYDPARRFDVAAVRIGVLDALGASAVRLYLGRGSVGPGCSLASAAAGPCSAY